MTLFIEKVFGKLQIPVIVPALKKNAGTILMFQNDFIHRLLFERP